MNDGIHHRDHSESMFSAATKSRCERHRAPGVRDSVAALNAPAVNTDPTRGIS